ncbi:MAG: TrbC/VirB2 family protein [Candidatus Nomurabacteria bacterium]|nr:TrbC/VirB2 family protein [Candidatus Nomurabacteria bacterium]
MNYIKKNLLNIILAVFMLCLPILSFAQTTTPVTIKNPIPSVTSVGGLIETILKGVIKIGMPVLVLAIIYCGFLFVSAQGKPESIKKAKDALLYTLIGAAILLGSWAIAQLIADTVKAL